MKQKKNPNTNEDRTLRSNTIHLHAKGCRRLLTSWQHWNPLQWTRILFLIISRTGIKLHFFVFALINPQLVCQSSSFTQVCFFGLSPNIISRNNALMPLHANYTVSKCFYCSHVSNLHNNRKAVSFSVRISFLTLSVRMCVSVFFFSLCSHILLHLSPPFNLLSFSNQYH